MRRLSAILLALTLTGLAGCGGKSSVEGARLASGERLPSGCVHRKAGASATVAFVARGQAWALDPASGRVTCLFAAPHPGLFTWGPHGDRALLARLEVRSPAGGPERAPAHVDPTAASWGRPTGKSIVFVSADRRALLKAHPAGGGFLDVTPVKGAEYTAVTYHPSGLAFAFVLRRHGRESIWLSSNLGENPQQLVHGRFHTGFDAIAFGDAGQSLYFAARHGADHIDVHVLPLVGATSAPVLWRGPADAGVTDLLTVQPFKAPTRVALTAGRSCAARRALIVSGRLKGADALPGTRPTRALGWIDYTQRAHLLVAAGGCGKPLDLYSVDSVSLRATLLIRGVDAAATRLRAPVPTPGLPKPEQGEGSSFA